MPVRPDKIKSQTRLNILARKCSAALRVCVALPFPKRTTLKYKGWALVQGGHHEIASNAEKGPNIWTHPYVGVHNIPKLPRLFTFVRIRIRRLRGMRIPLNQSTQPNKYTKHFYFAYLGTLESRVTLGYAEQAGINIPPFLSTHRYYCCTLISVDKCVLCTARPTDTTTIEYKCISKRFT